MLLAIDAGNTNIVFAVFEGTELKGSWRASTHARWTADEYAVWFTQLLALKALTPKDIDACIISSVVPDVLFSLSTLAKQYFGTKPRIVGEPGLDLGVRVLLDRPEEVGADRLVNAVAAHARYGGACIVVDFGTAITYDVVSAEGEYLGGIISPGIEISLEALTARAAKLPAIELGEPRSLIGKTTADAVRSGIVYGFAAQVDGIVDRLRGELGGEAPAIATGGLAHHIVPSFTESIGDVDELLTLRGLQLVWDRNR